MVQPINLSNNGLSVVTTGVRNGLQSRQWYTVLDSLEHALKCWHQPLSQLLEILAPESWEVRHNSIPSSVPTGNNPSKLHPATEKTMSSSSYASSWTSCVQPLSDLIVHWNSVVLKPQHILTARVLTSSSHGRTVFRMS